MSVIIIMMRAGVELLCPPAQSLASTTFPGYHDAAFSKGCRIILGEGQDFVLTSVALALAMS
jgi:hypothetical protein